MRSRATRIPAELWAVGALTALALIVRAATLASQSLWLDEAITAHDVRLSFGAMLSTVTHQEANPPLYYVLAWIWAHLFGTGVAQLRSLSALAGTAVVPLAYLCGRELVSRRAGLIAAALVSVNPFMIWYSQEARPYMLLAALTGASFYCFARIWNRRSTPESLVWWACFASLALATHFFAGFLVAPEAIALLWRVRSRATVAAVAVTAAVQVALLPLALSDSSHGVGWIKAIPLSIRIKQVPVEFGLGTLYKSPIVTHGLAGAAVLLAGVLLLLLAAGTRLERRGALIAGYVGAAAILAPLILAVLGNDYLVTRNLIPAWVPLATVLGAACAVPRARIAGGMLAAGLLIAFVLAGIRIGDHFEYQRPDWHGIAAALGRSDATRAIVAFPGAFAAEPLSYYMPGVPWRGPSQAPVSVSEVDVIANSGETPVTGLPRGVRLIFSRQSSGYEVARFALSPSWRLPPIQIGAQAGPLLMGPLPGTVVLVQRPPVRG